MNHLHQRLTQKYPSYNHWHQIKHHNKIHWGILLFFSIFVFGLLYTNFNTNVFAESTQTHLTQCGTLSTANTTYILDNDVRSEGTCFTIKQKNIALDLNGHTILYDDYQKAGFPNPDFELGEGDVPSDWDLSQAPTVKRKSNRDTYMINQWHLYFGEAPNNTKVISPWTYLPANSKAVVYYLRGDSSWAYERAPLWNIKVEYEDSSIVVSKDFSDLMTGNGYLEFNTMVTEGKYRATLTLVDGYGLKFGQYGRLPAIDLFDVRPARNYGISIIYGQTGIAIKNGKIIQGLGKSLRGHGIYQPGANGGGDLTITNISFENYGTEASAINTAYVSNVLIKDNEVINKSPYQFNRHQISAAFSVTGNNNTIIHNNTMDCGSGWGCIFTGGTQIQIYDNTLKSENVITNHHTIALYGSHDVSIHGNTIEGKPAGGILFSQSYDGKIFDNSITLGRHAPGLEYGYLPFEALNIKDYGSRSCHDLEVYNNDITLIGDYDKFFGPGGGYFLGIMNMCSGGNVIYSKNKITAKSIDPEIGLVGIEPGGIFDKEIIFYDNTIKSDGSNILFGGYAGNVTVVSNVKLIGNTLIKGDNPVNYHTFSTKRAGKITSDKTHFIDTKLQNGASLKDLDLGAQYLYGVNYFVDWYLNVYVKDQSNLSAAAIQVKVLDKNNTVVFEGKTDSEGKIQKIILTEFNKKNIQFKAPTTTDFTPHTVIFSLADNSSKSHIITMNKSQNLTYQIGGDIVVSDMTDEQRLEMGDNIPPIGYQSQPISILDYDVESVVIEYKTSEDATCKYAIEPNLPYYSMPNTFSTTGGRVHSSTISGLVSGTAYKYYVKCIDPSGNASITDSEIIFSVNAAPDLTIPNTPIVTPDTGLLLHAKMESEAEVNNPTVSTEKVVGWEEGKAIIKAGTDPQLLFETGADGNAARFVNNANNPMVQVQFAPGNFDFDDSDNDGGTLEFWLKFNIDPHVNAGNKFILDSEPYPRPLSIEMYSSDPYLAFEFHHPAGQSFKTIARFMVYTGGWSKWQDWKKLEWHKVTLTWKKNEDIGNAEMHLYLDGTQEGCPPTHCNDYYGRLPDADTLTEVNVGNLGGRFAIDFLVDELKSFNTAIAYVPPVPDTTAPSVPASLQATPISSSQINLSWTASTDNIVVSGYKVYRDGVKIATITSGTFYQDTGLQASTAYTYTVSAYDAAGNESGKSVEASATTLSSFKQSDLNQDGKTDELDFDILKQDFNRTDKPSSDLNKDGIVDSQDLGILMSQWSR